MTKVYIKTEINDIVGAGQLKRDIIIAKELRNFDIESEFILSEKDVSFFQKYKTDTKYHVIADKYINSSDAYLDIIQPGSLVLFDTDNPTFYSGNIIDTLRSNKVITACFTITDRYEITTDILINSNIIALTQSYITPRYTIKLLGPKYLVFSPEISALDNFEISSSDKNLLLFFGNADKHNLTYSFLLALEEVEYDFDSINVIIGSLNRHKDAIIDYSKKSNKNIAIYYNLTANEMINLYRKTYRSITSAGMTMWELALWGIPQVIVAGSPREKQYSDYLYEQNYIYKLADYDNLPNENLGKILTTLFTSSELQNLNVKKFSSIIDPKGANNIATLFNKILSK